MSNFPSLQAVILEISLLSVLLAVHFLGFAKQRLAVPQLIYAEVGLRSGLKLSLLYTLAFYLYFMLSLALVANTKPIGEIIMGTALLLLLYLPMVAGYAGVLGVIPACLLGYLSGLIIGWVLPAGKGQPPVEAMWISGAITAGLALLVNLVAFTQWDSSDKGLLNSYWIWVGIPSVIYIVWGGWMGYFVQRHKLQPTQANQPA